MIFIFLIIFGLVFGSFINVLVYRLPKGISLGGRSFCPRCKHQISWRNNVPLLSFVLLKGKCRSCKKPISIQYLIVELATALIFAVTYLASQGLALRGGMSYILCIYILIVISITVFVIDLKHQIIPDELIYAGYLISLIYLVFFEPSNIFNFLFSGFAVALFFLSLHLVTRGKGMGLGDVKLALVGGTLLGIPLSVYFVYIAFILGAVVGVVLILLRLSKFGKHIPFGPFLAVAFWISVLFGERLWKYVEMVLR